MTEPPRMPSPSEPWDVRETRIRLPRRVVQELKRTAEASGRTMNELIAGYIDSGLTSDAVLGSSRRRRGSAITCAAWWAE